MLTSQDSKTTGTGWCVTRRAFLAPGAFGLVTLSLADWLNIKARGEVQPSKARSVILLWMGGGPPQTDTFDPKPEAGEAYSGPLRKPLETNVPGIRIGELLPLLAKQADKYSIIRSMTHNNDGHETAAYIMLTGTLPAADLVYPAIGAVVAYSKTTTGSYQGELPPYISLTHAVGGISEGGFLGSSYKSFSTGGDPNGKEFRVQGLVPPRGLTAQQMQGRRSC